MQFLLNARSARWVMLASITAVWPMIDTAQAGRGDEPAPAIVGAASPAAVRRQVNISSESYALDGAVSGEVLTLRLSRKPDRSPVAGAQVELMIDGATGTAVERGNGSYTFQSAALEKPGDQELIITVKDGVKSDLLVGLLKQKDAARHPAGSHAGHDHSEAGHKAGPAKAMGDHAGHAHDGHRDEGGVKLTAKVMQEFGVEVERAEPGPIAESIARPAEVTFNMDRFAHVVPQVAGIVRSVNASQGDVVTADQVLAVLESRELAEAKSSYLAALERLDLAKSEFERALDLRTKNITSEKSFLTSRSAYAEARIAMRSAKQKLSSIGVGDDVLAQLAKEPDAALTHYQLRARQNGTVVQRHLVRGEAVPTDRQAFTIADLSSVWINISLYSADLAKVTPGQRVGLEPETGETSWGTISFVTPDVAEATRTATARIVLASPPRSIRPGMFITARIEIGHVDAAVRVASEAIQKHDDKDVVFAREAGVFKPRPVQIGRRNDRHVEIVAGLKAGDTIATKGSFLIKSQLAKASFGDGHNH